MAFILDKIGLVVVLCSLVLLAYTGRAAYVDTLRHRQRARRRQQLPRESSQDRLMFELVSGTTCRRRQPRHQKELSELLAS